VSKSELSPESIAGTPGSRAASEDRSLQPVGHLVDAGLARASSLSSPGAPDGLACARFVSSCEASPAHAPHEAGTPLDDAATPGHYRCEHISHAADDHFRSRPASAGTRRCHLRYAKPALTLVRILIGAACGLGLDVAQARDAPRYGAELVWFAE
jgi:hypothetical protein